MNSARRRICVVTGTRAEYGLLYWLLRDLRADPSVELQIVVTGMHLSPEFGLTYKVIESEGFEIAAKVRMLLSDDSPAGIAKAAGLGLIGFADAFERLAPEIVVLLGDRFEILSAAQAAMYACIPIAHLHGGEATEGLIDEAVRHAITKMAHLHFVAAGPYRDRVIQMGEAPERVYNFGAPGLDHLKHMEWLTRSELSERLGMGLGHPLFLVTYHPVTLENRSPGKPMKELLSALDEYPDASVVFTYPNADTRGRVLIELIGEYVQARAPRVKAFASLGQQPYLSIMRECDVVIGNSSSGITEAPALKKATVNLGDRQRGRLKASSVLDCPEQAAAIASTIKRALGKEFQASLPHTQSLYGQGGASQSIAKVLKTVDLADLIKKRFHTL